MNQPICVVTLALGLRPRQGLTKVRAKREAWESHLMLPGVQKSVRELTFTLPSGSLKWTPKFSKGDYRGQNSLD